MSSFIILNIKIIYIYDILIKFLTYLILKLYTNNRYEEKKVLLDTKYYFILKFRFQYM